MSGLAAGVEDEQVAAGYVALFLARVGQPRGGQQADEVIPRRLGQAMRGEPGGVRLDQPLHRPPGASTRTISARPPGTSDQWCTEAIDQAMVAEPSSSGNASAVPW